MPSAIYKIENTVSGRVYVGSAARLKHRWAVHRSLLKQGKHHSPALQRSWLKHGPEAFVFEVIEFVEIERLIEREQHWIDTLDAANPKTGFNVEKKASSSLGRKHTPESLAKMSAAHKGRKRAPRTDAHRKAISDAKTGVKVPALKKPKSKEHREALSAAKKGVPAPWIVESNKRRKGERHTPEARARMSAAQKNKKPATAETRAKMSAAAKKRTHGRNPNGTFIGWQVYGPPVHG